jgi:hypothetical protein
MPVTVQFSLHSGANFLPTKWLRGGGQENDKILLNKLFIFLRKVSRKLKKKYKSEVFYLLTRKLLSGCL